MEFDFRERPRVQLPLPVVLFIVSIVAFFLSADADSKQSKLLYGLVAVAALVFAARTTLQALRGAQVP